MGMARLRPTLCVLPDGKVQVIGGDTESTMEMFNPDAGKFTALAHLLSGSAAISTILRSQTRGALIEPTESKGRLFEGSRAAKDEDRSPDLERQLDRSGYTLTEFIRSNQALAAGGLSGSGQILATAILFSSSGASITTDKIDYLPGETVVISGAGWRPRETVSMVLYEEPATHGDRTLTSVADAHGNFTNSDLVLEEHDFGVTFLLTATGQNSGFTAQTTVSSSRSLWCAKAWSRPHWICRTI